MIRRMVIMLLLVTLLFGGIFTLKAFQVHAAEKERKKNEHPIVTVSSIVAKQSTWFPHTQNWAA